MASIFTKISTGDIPGEIVYSDERVFALLDINPKADGHTLVVPRTEVPSFNDLPEEDVTALGLALRTICRGVCQAMGTTDYNLVVNNGASAGQEVPHVHVHIIPRKPGGGRGDKGRLGEVADAIRKALGQ